MVSFRFHALLAFLSLNRLVLVGVASYESIEEPGVLSGIAEAVPKGGEEGPDYEDPALCLGHQGDLDEANEGREDSDDDGKDDTETPEIDEDLDDAFYPGT